MTLIFNGVEIEDAKYNGTSLEKIICNGVTVWEKAAAETIFNVSKITSNVYKGSTTYNNCKFIGFNVKAGNSDAEVTYGGITKTVTANSSADITFGQYADEADDGTPDTGNVTFKNVTSIGGFSFNTAKSTTAYAGGCINSVVDWGGLTTIGKNFLRGTSLTSFTIGGKVAIIDIGAFNSVTSLTSLTLGANVMDILTNTSGSLLSDVAPFIGCSNLNIYVDANNENFSAENGALFNKNKRSLYFVPYSSASSSYSVPSTVQIIRQGAFYGRNLSTVTLSSNIRTIEKYAFSSCANLTTVNNFSNVRTFGASAFANCKLTTLNFSSFLQSLGGSIFTNCPINTITFNGYSGSTPSAGAFSGMGAATAAAGRTIVCNANVPAHFFDVGEQGNAFKIHTLTFNGVTTVGDYAFNKVVFNENATINLGNSLTTIGSYAFANGSVTDASGTASSSLTFEIPASVTSMGDFSVNTFKNINDFGVRAEYPPSVSDSGVEIFATDYAGLGENLKVYVPNDSLADYQSEWYGLVDFMEGVIGW